MNYQTFELFYQYMQIIFLFQIILKSCIKGQNIIIGCRICRAGFNSWFEGFLKSPYFSFLKGPHSFNIDLRMPRHCTLSLSHFFAFTPLYVCIFLFCIFSLTDLFILSYFAILFLLYLLFIILIYMSLPGS